MASTKAVTTKKPATAKATSNGAAQKIETSKPSPNVLSTWPKVIWY